MAFIQNRIGRQRLLIGEVGCNGGESAGSHGECPKLIKVSVIACGNLRIICIKNILHILETIDNVGKILMDSIG